MGCFHDQYTTWRNIRMKTLTIQNRIKRLNMIIGRISVKNDLSLLAYFFVLDKEKLRLSECILHHEVK